MNSKRPVLMFLALSAIVACDEKKETVDAGAIDAGPQGIVVGGKLGQALASAQNANPAPEKNNSPDGPPENGIFPPGGADKIATKGSAMKVTVVAEGADPKTDFVYKLGDAEQKTTVTMSLRAGQPTPPIIFALTVKADKPKDKGDKDAAKDKPVHVVAKVTDVSLPKEMSAPKEMLADLAKLKGTEIRYTMTPRGLVSEVATALGKDADPQNGQIVASAAEVLFLGAPAFPDKPIGIGAQWMVADRTMCLAQFDCIRYRLFKLTKVEKEGATLSLDTRSYAASPELDAGRGQKLAMDQFESTGKGDILWNGLYAPAGADLSNQAVLTLTTPNKQKAQAQIQLVGRVEGPDADKKPSK